MRLSWGLPGGQGQGAEQGPGQLGWPYLVDETLEEPLGGVNASAHLFLVLTEVWKVLRTHPAAPNPWARAPWSQVDTLAKALLSPEDAPGPSRRRNRIGPLWQGSARPPPRPQAMGTGPLGSFYLPGASLASQLLCYNKAVMGLEP